MPMGPAAPIGGPNAPVPAASRGVKKNPAGIVSQTLDTFTQLRARFGEADFPYQGAWRLAKEALSAAEGSSASDPFSRQMARLGLQYAAHVDRHEVSGIGPHNASHFSNLVNVLEAIRDPGVYGVAFALCQASERVGIWKDPAGRQIVEDALVALQRHPLPVEAVRAFRQMSFYLPDTAPAG